MWLLVDIGIALAALLIVVLTGLHTWGRLRRMSRTTVRVGGHLERLAAAADGISSRFDAGALAHVAGPTEPVVPTESGPAASVPASAPVVADRGR